MAWIRACRTSKDERRYEVRYRDQSGRERSQTFRVRKDAQAFKLDVERRQETGLLYDAPPERFGAVADAWLERYVVGAAGRVRPRPKSIALTHESLAALAPLNDLTLDRFHRPLVEDFIAQLAARTPRRAEMVLALLKRILKAADGRGQRVDPSVFAVRLARTEEREPRFLTWDEVEELSAWLPEYISRIVPIATLTLLRRGEMLGLRDRDVDFQTGSIAVFGQSQDDARVRTKTRAGRRTVDVGPLALKFVRAQQLARAPNSEGLLFPTRSGGSFDAHNFMSQVYKPAARAASFPELTFHDLRHTGASLMIASGCHAKVIAEQMGHSDGGALVLRRYGHLYKGARKQAALALEAHILGQTWPAAGSSGG